MPEMYHTVDGKVRRQVAAPVDDRTYQELTEIARREQASLAALVRHAVEEYVARERGPRRHVD